MKKFHSLLIFLLWSSGFLLAQQSPDCEENVDATQDTEVVANTLQASNTLTVNRKLNSGDTLRLIGGQLIELLPGFEADEGSFIEGGNGDCVDLSAVLSSHIIACSVTQPVSDEGSDGVVTISISNMNFAGTIDIQWQQDGTLQNNKFDVDGSNPDKDVEIENLSAGTYEFVVSYTLRDYIGKIFTQTCTVTFTEKVLVEECEILGEDLPIRGTDGQLYCYKWSPSDDISEGYTDEDREIRVCPESSTDYFVTITDGLNVIEVKEFEVIKCDLEVTIESSAPAICNGEAVTLTASTSCTDCTYEWLSGESSASITLIEWDIVSVTITDSEGCKAEASLFIDDSPSVDGGIFVEKLSICNGEATTLSINEDVDVVWEDGSTDNERIITGGGLYSATMTDEFGCVTEDEVQIRENFKPTVNIVQSSQKLCEGGSVLLSLETNASDFFAEWSNGEDGDEIVVKEAGSYTVTLTDQNDCTTESEPIDLEGFGEQGAPSVVINADSPILCGVDNEVTLAVEILEET
ncbi:MAG: 3-coathanger stack domain-containing protein, partial [Bacteroidota bacterium]